MSEKSGKRLVPKELYIKKKLAKGVLYSVGTSMLVCSLGFLGLSVVFILLGIMTGNDASDPKSMSQTTMFLFAGCFGAVCLAALLCGMVVVKKGTEMEDVAPITRHNTADLPAVETLVRASELPLSHHHADLLRAANSGQDTAPEQLLRASVTSKQGADRE